MRRGNADLHDRRGTPSLPYLPTARAGPAPERALTRAAPQLARSIGSPHPTIGVFYDALDRLVTHPDEFPDLLFPDMERARAFGQRRDERMEAICLLLKAQALRTDLVTDRVGLPVAGSEFLQGLQMGQSRSGRKRTKDTIESWTGLSTPRLWRAQRDVMRAGWQVSKKDKKGRTCAPQPREFVIDEETGERKWRGYACVRKQERALYKALHIAGAMDEAKQEAAAERRKRTAAQRRAAKKAREDADRRQVEREIADAAQMARVPRIKAAPSPRPPSEADAEVQRRRDVARIGLGLRAKHPGWSREAVVAEAERLLDATGPPTDPF